METTTPFCAGTPVRESSRGIRRFVLSPTRNFNPSPGSSHERFAEIVRHVIDEAMNGCLRDAMPGNRIHGPSQRAEGWFLKHVDCVSPQCVSYLLVRVIYVVVTTNLKPFAHQSRPRDTRNTRSPQNSSIVELLFLRHDQ